MEKIIDLTGTDLASLRYKRLTRDYGANGKCKLIFPDVTSAKQAEKFNPYWLNGVEPETIVYQNGNYFGSKNNPYMVLYSVVENAETLDVHPDAVIINGRLANRTSLKEVRINSENLCICGDAFFDCPVLEKVVFSKGKEVIIGYEAFRKSPSLTQVVFDADCIYKFGDFCFLDNAALVNFEFPRKSRDKVGKRAFDGCGFKRVYLPAEVQYLENSFSPDVEVYYEGDCSALATDSYEYESSDDYSRNFHGGSMSYSTAYRYAAGDKYHSFVSYADYLNLSK